ncbi:preprotein translocase subunit SecY [Enterobacteriaceae bacterium ET-AT1-13]|nr:preprotein translocase subunit SecY [Enterobacteriaceae bacterium ET-AT1-13]WGS66347.1 preprotein translocase subunit SecY [Enterobacteriaceae bacterium Cmel17]WMC17370.1 MAG: preprotein translocase subunit SecY [Enterobacteriaceae bacterium Cmel21]WMC17577.1 MAG: preprotein translocase subunit SecY [Enterobacteriaceae bacterium PSmelAO3-2]WMC17782.1 MAG: preprotein translocase subunit SecY [Enterobacteriaceae bacterium PSmelAO3-1]WMC17985.1 MAG: preprotein translocase subunit SecY [Enterob
MENIFKVYKNGICLLKSKFIFLICILIIFRIGSFIPVPGINIINDFFLKNNNNNIFEMLNIFSGGSLSHISIFSLGLIPYVSASIIIQIINFIYPNLIKIDKYSLNYENKINQVIRYVAFFFSIIQSIIIFINFNKIYGFNNLIFDKNVFFYLIILISLITGSMILMWLGEEISEKGICNGISIIICFGILVGLPSSINFVLLNKYFYNFVFFKIFLFLILLFLIIYFIIFIECSQRRIFINYKNNLSKCKFYINQNIYLPIKINISGITPAIFSSSIVLFITNLLLFLIEKFNKFFIIKKIIFNLQPGKILYLILYINFIMFFSFVSIPVFFDSNKTANNLKKSGGFIYGIRPGIKTSNYISNIVLRLNNLGTLYIIFICLIPEIFNKIIKIPFYLSSTSILIVTLVIMDFISQIQILLMSSQYNSVFKKNKL